METPKKKSILVPAEAKPLAEYEQSKPLSLSLFEQKTEKREYSNTVELYDFIPKYFWGKTKRIGGRFLDPLERDFEYRGTRYRVKIRPAGIEGTDGVERYYFPSKREELVEDALRKFIAEGQGLFLDDRAGVAFTLYQLQKELRRTGHSYSKDQIKDALLICARTNITIMSEDGGTLFVSHLFETLGLQCLSRRTDQTSGSRAFVRFNSLVTGSITSRSYRQINYEKVMSYRTVAARQLHKRLSHHYTQASLASPYRILLSTIIRDFGLTPYRQLRDNLRDVETALDEMIGKKALLAYKTERVVDEAARQKLLDAKFILTPDPLLTGEIIAANRLQSKLKLAGP